MDLSITPLPTFQPAELEFLLDVLGQPEEVIGLPKEFAVQTKAPKQLLCAAPRYNKLSKTRRRGRTHGGRRKCKIKGCEKRDQKRGLCAKHGGVDQCRVFGCANVARVAQRCNKHKLSLAPLKHFNHGPGSGRF